MSVSRTGATPTTRTAPGAATCIPTRARKRSPARTRPVPNTGSSGGWPTPRTRTTNGSAASAAAKTTTVRRMERNAVAFFLGRPESEDEDAHPPIDDAADFDLTHRQAAIKTRKQMEAVWEEILSHYADEARRQRYITVRRRRDP